MRAGSPATLPPPTRPPEDAAEPGSASVLLAIVNGRGVVDASGVRAELAQTISAGATRLLVDLSRADEVATTALNALLDARRELWERGGKIAVVLSPRLRRRFEVLRLDRRFLLADDRLHAAELLGLVQGSPPEAGAPRPHAHAA
jgi:anti-anti-sigma regulatory factor